MGKIDGTGRGEIGEGCGRGVSRRTSPSTPSAGVYIATMMAQVDTLLEHGHPARKSPAVCDWCVTR
jgi:hypothetical protein